MDGNNLDKKTVDFATVGDVVDFLEKLDDKTKISPQVADILQKILKRRISDSTEAIELLKLWIANHEDGSAVEIGKLEDATGEFEAKSLTMLELQTLLDAEKRATAQKKDRPTITTDLAKKYGVKESRVRAWLDRVDALASEAMTQGMSVELARNVAEKGVLREARIIESLTKTAGVDRQEAVEIARQTIEETVKTGEAIMDPDLIQAVAAAGKIKVEVKPIVLKQFLRLQVDVGVAKKVEEEVQLLVSGLEKGLALSQPGIVFDRHKPRIREIAEQAVESVWAGESDNLAKTEVSIRDKKKIRRVDFTEAIEIVLETTDAAIAVEIKKVNTVIETTIGENVEMAAKYEFVKRSETITGIIEALNPTLDHRTVTNYSETIVRATMPVLAPGERVSRAMLKNDDLSLYPKTSLVFRDMSGMVDHAELQQAVAVAESAGVTQEYQDLSRQGRAVGGFLSSIRKNPLLASRVGAIRQRLMRRLFSNRVVIDGVTSFVSRTGFSAVFGVEVATAVPAVMGYFGGGGSFGGAVAGIVKAGGVSGWVSGLMAGGGAVAGATGEVALAAGTAAATGAGAVATTTGAGLAGLTAAQAIPVVGQVLAAVATVVTIARPIVKKINASLKKLGIDLGSLPIFKLKKFISEDLGLGNFVGSVASFAISLGGMLIALPSLIMAVAFSRLLVMIGWLVPAIIGGIMLYMIIVVIPQASTLAPTADMIAGSGQDAGNFDPNAPPLRAKDIEGECSVASHTSSEIKQNVGPWAGTRLPKGCTIGDSGCGPTSVSIILRAKNSSLTPDVLVSRPEYAGAGCAGTTMTQNANMLRSELGGGVEIDGACSINSIARSICEGNKIVMILANFYQNSDDLNETGGHYVVAVGVNGGQIVTKDPIYHDNTPFLLEGESVHVGAIHNIKGCIVVDADRI